MFIGRPTLVDYMDSALLWRWVNCFQPVSIDFLFTYKPLAVTQAENLKGNELCYILGGKTVGLKTLNTLNIPMLYYMEITKPEALKNACRSIWNLYMALEAQEGQNTENQLDL